MKASPSAYASKTLIVFGLGSFTYGVGYDIAHYDDAHTVSRVPFAMAISTATDSTISAVTYTSNNVTGEELKVPPRDARTNSVQEPETYVHQSYLRRVLRGDA